MFSKTICKVLYFPDDISLESMENISSCKISLLIPICAKIAPMRYIL